MDGLNTLEMLPGLGGAHAVIDTLYEQDRRKIEHEEKLLHNMIGKAVAKLAVHPKCLGDLSSLSADALRLISKAYEGLAGDDCVDYHTHVLGSSNCCDTGCFSPTADGPLQASFMEILKRSAGVQVAETADSDFVSLLLKLRARGKNVILAFDAHYTEDGELDLKKTGMYVPNDYVFRLVEKHSDKFLPSCSVHPYRKDALQELERCHQLGARLIKWLPNAMGIDPSSDKCQAYYDKCRELGMVILSHCGEEKAVSSDPKFQKMGNPLLFRRAFNSGVKIIVAHCASLGSLPDLDKPDQPVVECFSLFLRLVREFPNLCYGDISAITLINRYKTFVPLLQATDVHKNLINGTDYPLVNIPLMNSTKVFARIGLIAKEDVPALKELFHVHPPFWDFVIKRIMRGPNGESFPDCVFLRNKTLGI